MESIVFTFFGALLGSTFSLLLFQLFFKQGKEKVLGGVLLCFGLSTGMAADEAFLSAGVYDKGFLFSCVCVTLCVIIFMLPIFLKKGWFANGD